MGRPVLFVVEDATSLTVLQPIANRLNNKYNQNIEFFFCDSFWERSGREVSINRNDLSHPYRNVNDYLKRNSRFNYLPTNLCESIAQRLFLDSGLRKFWYDVSGLIEDIDPKLIITANDSFPFIRQLIGYVHNEQIQTVTIQHGIYSGGLNPANLNDKLLFPNVPYNGGLFERAKRAMGFRYGITTYCNPYTDIVMTLGDFYTELIHDLREGYPCFGKTDIYSTGSPEYNSDVIHYREDVSSILFLSQQKYETGEWDKKQQQEAIDILNTISENIPVTVRPHPKDSAEKIQWISKKLPVSQTKSLVEDIARHDAAITVDSTAIYEAVIQGKTCGILTLDSSNHDFEPLIHPHLITITEESIDIEKEASNRSVSSQKSYLSKFCTMPATDSTVPARNSLDYITEIIDGKCL